MTTDPRTILTNILAHRLRAEDGSTPTVADVLPDALASEAKAAATPKPYMNPACVKAGCDNKDQFGNQCDSSPDCCWRAQEALSALNDITNMTIRQKSALHVAAKMLKKSGSSAAVEVAEELKTCFPHAFRSRP